MRPIRQRLVILFIGLTCTIAAAQQGTDPPRKNQEPPIPGLGDLPLTEVPSAGTPSAYLAVHITGDGGYGTTDKGVSDSLAARGIPVVVLNSLHYFWKKRTPAEAAADLQRILEHYRLTWHREKYILIGYSMGADDLPFMLTR